MMNYESERELDLKDPESTPAAFRHFMLAVHQAMVKGGFDNEQAMAAMALMGNGDTLFERMFLLAFAWQNGKTLEEIGNLIGVTRERVRQILAKAEQLGVIDPNHVGGYRMSRLAREQESKAVKVRRWTRKIELTFGCGPEEFIRCNQGARVWKGPQNTWAKSYYMQKRSAPSYGNVWNLSFPDWCNVWEESGKWNARGRGRGKFALARLDSSKPFEIGNVKIMKGEDVSSRAGGGGRRTPDEYLKFQEKQAEALRLHETTDMTYDDIAKKLGIKNGSTASGYACAERRRLGRQVIPPRLRNVPRPRRTPTGHGVFPAKSLGARLTEK